LAEIIERFQRMPLLSNVRLVSADEDKLYTQPGAEFGIVCDINLTPPPITYPPTSPFARGEKERDPKEDLED